MTVLPTPGHTPGHVLLQVELPGTWVFTADPTDLAQNLLDGHDQVVLNAMRHPPGGHR